MGIYTEAYHHFAWATRKREHFITPETEREMYRHIRHLCKGAHVQVHALNGMPDHVHLVATLPDWQEGYGWLTFTQDDLPRIVRYVDRQKERHALGRLSPKMELTADWEQFKSEQFKSELFESELFESELS